MKQSFLLSLILFVGFTFYPTTNSNAQGVGINPSGNAPHSSAGLDVDFTDRGTLITRMTTTQRDSIASPANGLMIWNTTTNCLDVFVVNAWQSLTCGCTSAPAAPGSITGTTNVCANSASNIYSITAVFSATSYTWNVPTGSVITAGQGTPSITVTFGSNSGNITVTANNGCGASAPTTQAITVTSIPAAPTANAAGNVTCTGFTASWSSSPGATAYYLDVATDSGFTNLLSSYNNLNVGNVQSTNITGLTANTYYYRVRASNLCGTSDNSGPVSAVVTAPYVAITLTNNQGTATGTGFQQMITVNSNDYNSYESSGLQNIIFSTDRGNVGGSATALYAWCESGCSNVSTSTVWWVNLGSNIINSGSSLTIYMNFMPTAVMNSSSSFTGAAPQLTGTYGQYDNGANVFSFYDNFEGTSVNTSRYTISVPSGTSINQNNGVTITTGSSTYGGLIHNAGYPSSVAQIFDGYVTAVSGVAAGLALQTGNTESSSSLDFNYWGGSIATGCMAAPGMQPAGPSLQITTGIMGGAWLTSSSQVWYKNYSATAGSITQYSIPSTIYPSIGIYYSSSGTSITFQWIRNHLYPPNGAMPGVSIGSVCQ